MRVAFLYDDAGRTRGRQNQEQAEPGAGRTRSRQNQEQAGRGRMIAQRGAPGPPGVEGDFAGRGRAGGGSPLTPRRHFFCPQYPDYFTLNHDPGAIAPSQPPSLVKYILIIYTVI